MSVRYGVASWSRRTTLMYRRYLDELESFDRGWYAGPFGWISGAGAEFVVAIRSGLVCPVGPETTTTSTASTADNNSAPAAASGAAGELAPPAPLEQPPHPLPHPLPPPPTPTPTPTPAPVAASSSLVHMFAGVGVVRGSDPAAEWQELDLKVGGWAHGWGGDGDGAMMDVCDPTPPRPAPPGWGLAARSIAASQFSAARPPRVGRVG